MSWRIPPLALTLLLMPLAWFSARLLPQWQLGLYAGATFGWLLALLGIAVCGMGVAHFRRAGTTLDPRVPDKASTLVSHGIYRITRNPMYLGFVLLLAGWGLLLDNLVTALAFPAAFAAYIDRLQIPHEEEALLARFGDDYAAYMRAVRRWI